LKEYNWHGGILAPSRGMIYAFPAHHSHVLKIDTNIITHNKSRISLIPINRASYDSDDDTRYKWLGGSIGEDGNIYGMPSDASSILKINTSNDQVSTFGKVSEEKNKWQGAVLSKETGYLYAIPSNAKHILCIDTRKESDNDNICFAGNLTTKKDKWQGGFVGADGSIYCVPENFDKILKLIPNGKMPIIEYLSR